MKQLLESKDLLSELRVIKAAAGMGIQWIGSLADLAFEMQRIMDPDKYFSQIAKIFEYLTELDLLEGKGSVDLIKYCLLVGPTQRIIAAVQAWEGAQE